jgi:hypothetical protein
VKFWFWFLWSIDAVIAAVALYFFFSLAVGGRVGAFNILPWLAILAALAAFFSCCWQCPERCSRCSFFSS